MCRKNGLRVKVYFYRKIIGEDGVPSDQGKSYDMATLWKGMSLT